MSLHQKGWILRPEVVIIKQLGVSSVDVAVLCLAALHVDDSASYISKRIGRLIPPSTFLTFEQLLVISGLSGAKQLPSYKGISL